MFKKSVLDSGITVVTESHRSQRSVAVGAYVLTGTRDEPAKMKGISHVVEHMVFKGTRKRTASDIARSIEAVGGDLNAYTTREYTCFHATSLRDDVKLDIEVLGDLVCNATFVPREVERELKVIQQELLMNDDTPEDYYFDLFFEKIYAGYSLGWPILGTEKSLGEMKRNHIKKFYKQRYVGNNIIVAAAGDVEHDLVVENVEKYFKVKKSSEVKKNRRQPEFQRFREIFPTKGEQTHIIIGAPAVGFTDKNRFDWFVLNALLGGGMSSKLYQSIREKRGLAYSVYSNLTTFTDTGVVTIYVGTEGKHVRTVMDSIEKDIKLLKKKKISEDALELFKQQVRGGILLGSDDMENRMTSLGVNEMTFGKYVPVEDVVEGLESVSASKVRDLAIKFLDGSKISIMVAGPVKKKEIGSYIAEWGIGK